MSDSENEVRIQPVLKVLESILEKNKSDLDIEFVSSILRVAGSSNISQTRKLSAIEQLIEQELAKVRGNSKDA